MIKTVYGIMMPDNEKEFLESTDSLFHFTKCPTAIEYILKSKVLRLGNFINTNDPLEYSNRIYATALSNDNEEVNIQAQIVKNELNNVLLRKTFFSSFCTNTVNRKNIIQRAAFDNARMWSQYGENHEGVCFVFSKVRLLNSISKYNDENITTNYNQVVRYNASSKNLRKTVCIGANEIEKYGKEVFIKKYIAQYKNALFFNKLIDYKDENEYRIIIIQENVQQVLINISESLLGVITGDRFKDVYLPSIQKLLTNDVPCYSLQWSHGSFFLKKKRLLTTAST